MIDKFRKGKRIYSHWDKKSEQVTVVPKQSPRPPQTTINVDVPVPLQTPKPANLFAIHHREDEFVIDCLFLPAGTPRAKAQSRVILNPRNAKKLLSLLKRNI